MGVRSAGQRAVRAVNAAGTRRVQQSVTVERGLDKATVERAATAFRNRWKQLDREGTAPQLVRDAVLRTSHPRVSSDGTYELLVRFDSADRDGRDSATELRRFVRNIVDHFPPYRELRIAVETVSREDSLV